MLVFNRGARKGGSPSIMTGGPASSISGHGAVHISKRLVRPRKLVYSFLPDLGRPNTVTDMPSCRTVIDSWRLVSL